MEERDAFDEAWARMTDEAMRAFDAAPPRFRATVVRYRQTRRSRVVLPLTVWAAEGPGWEKRVRRTAHVVGALHFHLYDLEA